MAHLKSETNVPDVIVFDAEQRTSLASVRSLGRRGLRVFAAGLREGALAMTSRYCDGTLVYPDPMSDARLFSDWLHELGRRWPGVVILPVTDVSVPPSIAAILAGANLRGAFPPLESYDLAIDKYRLGKQASDSGLNVPATMTFRRENLQELATIAYEFPVVVKPRRSATETSAGVLRRGVSYAASRVELDKQVRNFLVDDVDEVMVQQRISGTGMGVFALYNRGKPVFYFSHRRIREKPPSGGVSVLSASQPLPTSIMIHVEQLLTSLKWHGPAMVEFKVDRSGKAWLMEINARLWGSVQLAIDCDADFPFFLYELATGKQPSAPAHYAVGRQLRWFLGDLDGLYLALKAPSSSLATKLATVCLFCIPWRPGMRYEIFRVDDMAPAWTALRQYVSQIAEGRFGR